MADTSNTHIIIDKTIAAADTAETFVTARTPVAWFAIQNNHAANPIYLKTSDANDITNSVKIIAGARVVFPCLVNSPNPYDLFHYRVVSATITHPYTVEYVKG